MDKILVSSCLLGEKVRYNGSDLPLSDKNVEQWIKEDRIVSVCPEVDAGMSIPREPVEIQNGNGHRVLAGKAAVSESRGRDVTQTFIRGAQSTLALCLKHNIGVAVLTEGSPSCGSSNIYDGTFTGRKISGSGVTAALLREKGIEVFNQYQTSDAERALHRR